MTTTDPNGFFRAAAAAGQQEIVVVKIQNVSARPELNGRLGLAGEYHADRGRYLIRLIPNQAPADHTATSSSSSSSSSSNFMLSLKPEHVILANWMERMMGQYQLMRYDPQVHLQVRQLYQQLAQRIAPLPVPVAVGIMILLLLLSCYMLGITTTIFWTSALALLGMYVVVPYYNTNRHRFSSYYPQQMSAMIQSVGVRVQHQLEHAIPMLRGGRLNPTRALALVVVVVGIFIVLMMVGWQFSGLFPRRATPKLPWDTTTAATTTTTSTNTIGPTAHRRVSSTSTTTTTTTTVEDYYKWGFEDAKEGRPYGTSLPTTTSTTDRGLLLETDLADQDDVDFAAFPSSSSSSTPPPRRSRRTGSISGGSMMSTALSGFFVARTVWELGRDPTMAVPHHGNVFQQWNWQRALHAVRTLPTWQMAILGMSIYRLVSAILGM